MGYKWFRKEKTKGGGKGFAFLYVRWHVGAIHFYIPILLTSMRSHGKAGSLSISSDFPTCQLAGEANRVSRRLEQQV